MANGKIVRDSAGRLFAVTDTGNPDLEHCWLGVAVKRSGSMFVAKAGAREVLVRKAGCTVVEG